MEPLQWGIASCCKSSYDFATALLTFSKEKHLLIGVASLNMEDSQEFSRRFQVPGIYDTYDGLATDPNINIVYVAVQNGSHFDVSKQMISHGKHVVCEKPLCSNEKRAKELMILAKIKKVFLMEAMWSKCFPGFEYLMTAIDEGEIGEVLFVQITFGRKSYNKKRLRLKEMVRGSVMDFGSFALSFQEQIFKNLIPTKMLTTGNLNNQDVDESASCILNYPDGKTVVISIHTRCNLPNEAIVVGTEGTIRIPHFWFPTHVIMPEEIKRFPLPNEEKTVNRSVAFQYLIEEVASCIERGLIESEKHSHATTLQVIHWMDLWRKQMEVLYEGDEQ